MTKETLDLYTTMQNLNRATIKHAADTIKTGMSLPDIKALCEAYMVDNGADSFWYWDVALSFLPERIPRFLFRARNTM